SRLRSRRRTVVYLPKQRADRDSLAVLGDDLTERAGRRRRNFDRHLVGLELDQGVVDGNGITRLFEPAADGGLGNGFTERRNANFSHDLVSLITSAVTNPARHPPRKQRSNNPQPKNRNRQRGLLDAPLSRGTTHSKS